MTQLDVDGTSVGVLSSWDEHEKNERATHASRSRGVTSERADGRFGQFRSDQTKTRLFRLNLPKHLPLPIISSTQRHPRILRVCSENR
ncbi:hypothetical protein BLNAU_8134 [Blattamonas nauphoetae]|uniref:Uncharacterized protein n=1 Tax=Blattamonas nauphoetae TaxID=2049346 RepID=A0ABQ9XZE1_9EUKA|nr:hypothetical protein BLNAU_8134 [Blattamonas nauphoetae]